MNQEKLGKFIEKIRKERNLTQKTLGEKVGVSNGAVSKWECGNNLPDMATIVPLSEALDIDVVNLLKCRMPSEDEVIKRRDEKIRMVCYKNIKYLVFLMLLVFFIIVAFLPNVVKKTVSRLRPPVVEVKNEVRVYKILSEDKTFNINGYVMYDNNENIVNINEIVYQGNDIGTDREVYAENIKVYLDINDEIIYKYLTDNSNRVRKSLSNILNKKDISGTESISNVSKLADLEDYFSTAAIKIECFNGNKKIKDYKIDIKLQEKFANL